MLNNKNQEKQTYAKRIDSSFGESFRMLRGTYGTRVGLSDVFQKFSTYTHIHPYRATVMVAGSGLAILTSLGTLGVGATVAQSIGIAAFLLARESATFKEHRHILSVASLSVLLATGQQALMAGISSDAGAYLPGMFMLVHAAATLGAFSIIPEDRRILRNVITWGGGVAGALGAAWTAHAYGDGSGFIPAATTLGNAVLFSTSDNNTPRARLGYVAMNASHLFYWATQPVASLALMATEGVYALTHISSIIQHDIPYDPDATIKQKITGYFNVLRKGKESVYPTNIIEDTELERLDTKCFKAASNLIFGK